MQEIIAPVERELIKAELTKEAFIRYTNNGNNEVYLVNYHTAPHIMREIGRLRELTFRGAGGGTGLPLDIDENDTCEHNYDQLIAWNPEEEEIIAGYRVIKCKDAIDAEGNVHLSTAHYFQFSEKFKTDYLPYTLELGRSWVQPRFQPAIDNRKGLFSLDNLWDGLGALVVINPDIKYLFGKVTMYPHYNATARDLLIYFMEYYFPDREKLVLPFNELNVGYKTDITPFFGIFDGLEYKEGYKVLNTKVRELGENIPPLINTYMNLSPTMRTFGTAMNDEFGEVEETGIMITLEDIYPAKKERHMITYERDKYYGKRERK
ncbi:acetyltransferase (GNAT) family protein [Sphingobacterium allocomposti]|uniref:Acetyltransferase (GNAT) family protein n=1 Tax=Sphingobacterium allocomposti TaxID=415956 RepID=A0A5S5DPB7_9SPHI|nr:GNAT family N-acetyltransferase [Sphingobacterium composti Yoo et al. 2007 non Ten et al. 2007]TYP97757.1 acetyltransferase (GNAT) family protein [Sphingobacterium composti Yoo et al. 2007 non Ten et al. 2007]